MGHLKIEILLFLCCALVLSSSQPLPDDFSWGDIDGVSYLGPVKNQNFPYACNSGWAFSTINMLESRIKRRRKASSPDISLSTQVLLSCDTLDFGCLGGDPSNALRWIHRNNITDETCHSYKARGYTQGEKCTSQTKCQKCNTPNKTCNSQQNSKVYNVSLHGTLASEENMQQEIKDFGPIVCGISVTSDLKNNYRSGIYQDTTGAKGANHFVMIYGWGYDNQTDKKYWNVRNSWGPNWGQNGNFRIIRGSNSLGIENMCYWAALTDTWTNDVRNNTLPTPSFQNKISYQLPKFLTASKSTLTPKYCQSSWAFSITQMLRDRAYRSTKGKQQLDFSVQALLNCGLGSCEKQTDPFEALSFIHKYGIPEEGCQTYMAQRPVRQNCSAFHNCATCSGTSFNQSCKAIEGYKRWKSRDYGTLSGATSMKEQIKNYGPIICGMDKNSTVFQNYQGGVIKQVSVSPQLNHYVEVVGFGSDSSNGQYWIARNSWGTAWGEEGFFRIQVGSNNLGIEKRCLWANLIL